MRYERVVLIGFMGAGKSAVGARLADLLNWEFVDLDAEIERRAGMPVGRIFAERGEAGFRRLEAAVSGEVAARRRMVLAVGGGWAAQPGLMQRIQRDAAVVWLRVPLQEALRRAARDGATRPLLQGPDAVVRAAALLREREPLYARAAFSVDTSGKEPDAVAREVQALLEGAWQSESPRAETEPGW